jgi:hypothetical protein
VKDYYLTPSGQELVEARFALGDLTDLHRKNRFWMVLERDHTEVCLKNPGFPQAGRAGMVPSPP